MRFQDPWFLLLLAAVPLLVWRYVVARRKRVTTVRFSTVGHVAAIRPSRAVRWRHSVFFLRLVAVALLVIALARPQAAAEYEEVLTEGIDIMLVLDVSSSMLAEDFKPTNRVEMAKQVIETFIAGRTNDRIGLVLFSAKALTQCPLTLDYGVLTDFVRRAKTGMIQDGTAIGTALATAVQRIKGGKGKSKVIVLLTDGINNTGQVDPRTAADVAAAFGIKIYTIGAGKPGAALYPIDDPVFGKRYVRMPTELDEASLQAIADATGGKYFRATDSESLKSIYERIDAMEKTKVQTQKYTKYTDLFWKLLVPALALLVVEIVLAGTRFRRAS
jgi:Ca-activated chloride channel family protein